MAHWPLPARLVLLQIGLLVFGFAIAAEIQANVGLAPWDAFHVGLNKRAPFLSVGQVSILVGIVIQTTAWRLFSMPIGPGSVLNVLLIGFWIDRFRPLLPTPAEPWLAWALFLAGIGLSGAAIGAYVAADLGAGPRDSFALGLARKTGWPVRWTRSGTELCVLLAGLTMGAKVGLGTLVFALTIGPAMQAGLRAFGIRR